MSCEGVVSIAASFSQHSVHKIILGYVTKFQLPLGHLLPRSWCPSPNCHTSCHKLAGDVGNGDGHVGNENARNGVKLPP